jgi:hypothetical protein
MIATLASPSTHVQIIAMWSNIQMLSGPIMCYHMDQSIYAMCNINMTLLSYLC